MEKHLYQEKLGEAAKNALDRIAARLPPPDKWEDTGDGKVEAIRKDIVSGFQEDITEVRKACRIKGRLAYAIFHYKQPESIPYNPSDPLEVIVPLQSAGNPKIKDKDLTYGWATYTTQAEEITAGVVILWIRAPEGIQS